MWSVILFFETRCSRSAFCKWVTELSWHITTFLGCHCQELLQTTQLANIATHSHLTQRRKFSRSASFSSVDLRQSPLKTHCHQYQATTELIWPPFFFSDKHFTNTLLKKTNTIFWYWKVALYTFNVISISITVWLNLSPLRNFTPKIKEI